MTQQQIGASSPPPYYTPVEVVPIAGDPFDPSSELLTPRASDAGDDTAGPAMGADRPTAGDVLPAPSAGRRQWRFVPRTLTARLVVGVVVLVVLVVGAAGVATYELLGRFLTNRLDQQVGAAADQNVRISEVCIRAAPSACSLTFGGSAGAGSTSGSAPTLRGSQRLWIAVLDRNGDPLPLESTSADLLIMNLTSGQRASIVNAPASYRTLQSDNASIRVTGRTITTTTGLSYYEVVGLSTDDKTNTLHTLLFIELAIGAGAVVLASVATSFGVRLSLRPLRRVTNTARAVTAELSPEGAGLDRRVTVTETDTEVGRLAESVNTLLSAVETEFAARVESERRMRQFMADASHELRTPLTSIRGYAELARMRRTLARDGEPGVDDADALDRIESEGTRMSRLVEDLLTLARGDTGAPIERAPIDLDELLDDAVEGVRAAHPSRDIGIRAEPGLVVAGDRDQLLRVVRNLVTNAAVHTAAGGPIRVVASREGQLVIIRVIDVGPGLPPEQAAHVFERFWRSDTSRARASGGSGLGLAIVAAIVAAHGGRIRFDSAVAAGSTVTVSLPAS